MRSRFALAAVVVLIAALAGVGTAQAKPTAGQANHGQCVSSSPQPDGKGGRSAVAHQKGSCTPQLACTENGIVVRDSATNTVTITGTGAGTPGSSLECTTSIQVTGGESTISFTYDFADGTDPCGGGVPRLFVRIGETYYNTFDDDSDCSEADGNRITYTIPVTGTVTQVGFVYDRGDNGSITYSDATVGGITINI
jgi:hypothetical protein